MTKYVTIEVHYTKYGVRSAQRGTMNVNPVEYHKNPEKESIRVAQEFVDKYIDGPPFVITKITCNNIDITKLLQDEQNGI